MVPAILNAARLQMISHGLVTILMRGLQDSPEEKSKILQDLQRASEILAELYSQLSSDYCSFE